MAYCTHADVKSYLGIDSAADDTLITELIDVAQSQIDAHCHRTFEALADSTRLVSVDHADGANLWLPDDLCAITSVTNNADGVTETITIDTHAVTIPRYSTPYYGIKMLVSADKIWEYTDDAEEGISIVGRWAFSLVAPDDVKDVCKRLAARLYRLKDTGLADAPTAAEILMDINSRVKV